MATDAVSNKNPLSPLDQLTNTLNAGIKPAADKSKELGKDAFIKMLVEQLKHQDPTEPVKNEELAVNLAQFSQVEQLVEINKKLDGGGIGDTASLATFLGTEVLVPGNSVDVRDSNAGSIFFELPTATNESRIQVLNSSGSVVAEKSLGSRDAGRQVVQLSDLAVPNGSYTVQVNSTTASGENISPTVNTGGIVTGFIPGADPVLLVGDREVRASEISLVNLPRY